MDLNSNSTQALFCTVRLVFSTDPDEVITVDYGSTQIESNKPIGEESNPAQPEDAKNDDGDNQSTATAFIYEFELANHQKGYALVTCKHAIEKTRQCIYFLHQKRILEDGRISRGLVRISVPDHPDCWVKHPKEDLCALPINPHNIPLDEGWQLEWRSLQDFHFPKSGELRSLFALEDVTVVGYPFGMWATKDGFPILRHGTTATHPAIDFDNGPYGLVDVAVCEGCSGSPVLIIDEGPYSTTEGTRMGDGRLRMLGVLTLSRQEELVGRVVGRSGKIAKIKKVSALVDTHLGMYVKAELMEDLKNALLSLPIFDSKKR